jgi:hypothetical protein
MDFKEIKSEDVELTHLPQDGDQRQALMNTAMKFRVP